MKNGQKYTKVRGILYQTLRYPSLNFYIYHSLLVLFSKGNMFGHYIMVDVNLSRIIVPHDPSAIFLNPGLKQN